MTKIAVLYPGKQNHWIVALPRATGSMQDREDAAKVWFTIWFPDQWEDLRVTGSQVGNPGAIKANYISKDPDAGKYGNPDTTYVAIAFDYLGDDDFIGWPENGSGTLYAVAQGVPTIHLKTPIEQELDTIDRTVDDIEDDIERLAKRAKEAGKDALDAAEVVAAVLTFGAVIGAGAWLLNTIRGRR